MTFYLGRPKCDGSGFFCLPVEMQNAQACCHCGEHDHRSFSCPELAAPIHANEIFKPPAGAPQGGDDDEAAKLTRAAAAAVIGESRKTLSHGLFNLLQRNYGGDGAHHPRVQT